MQTCILVTKCGSEFEPLASRVLGFRVLGLRDTGLEFRIIGFRVLRV
jgi:hypothetical protein